MGRTSSLLIEFIYDFSNLWKLTFVESGLMGYRKAMEQTSIETALATQTRPFVRSKGRGWGVQCKHIKRSGNRCNNWAIQGAFVCYKHGGQLPVVRQAAEARKMVLANLAISVIQDLIEHAEDEGTRLRAAKYAIRFAEIEPGRIRTPRHGKVRETRAIEAPKSDTDTQIDAILSSLREIEA